MMNSPLVVQQSSKTAKRLLSHSSDAASLIEAAYQAILNRPPDEAELQEAVQFLNDFGDAAQAEKGVAVLCQTLFASAEFRYLY
jgi:hypothetical protein